MNYIQTNEIEIQTDILSLTYPLYPDISYDICKELYRGDLYCNLLKNFTKSCLENLNESIFSHKKSANRTITNLLASWFFTLYQYYDFKDDPFFPTNYSYTNTLEKTLKDYCSLSKIDCKEKINNIITDLSCYYKNILEKLKEYKIQNNIIFVTKINIYQKRDKESITFYKLILNDNMPKIMNNKLNNIINNIIIPVNQYNMMKNRYNGNDIDNIIWIIIYRYQLLSSNNNQLAVLQHILEKMKNDFNLSVECFASAINGSLSNYCSLYYDVEKYFGSIGSFFQMIPTKGVYSFNPPYQYDIISNGITRIINIMKLSKTEDVENKLCFIITIPIWDIEGKKYMKENMTENNNNTIDYDDFNIMNDIRQSIYFKGLRMISKNDFTYFDHNFHLYKNKTIQNTYVIIMSNYECDYIEKINKYDFFSYDNNNII